MSWRVPTSSELRVIKLHKLQCRSLFKYPSKSLRHNVDWKFFTSRQFKNHITDSFDTLIDFSDNFMSRKRLIYTHFYLNKPMNLVFCVVTQPTSSSIFLGRQKMNRSVISLTVFTFLRTVIEDFYIVLKRVFCFLKLQLCE